jgi:hypothetical protein
MFLAKSHDSDLEQLGNTKEQELNLSENFYIKPSK